MRKWFRWLGDHVGLYGKEIQTLIGTVLLSISASLADDGFLDSEEMWTAIGVGVGFALTMSFIANAQSGPLKYVKAALAAIAAGIGTLIPSLPGGISSNELVLIVVAMLGLGGAAAAISSARRSDQPSPPTAVVA